MTTSATQAVRSRRQYVTAGLASMMGTTIEWYDFSSMGLPQLSSSTKYSFHLSTR